VHSKTPLLEPRKESNILIKVARAAEANSDNYFLDSQLMLCE
jgi:hypothetical protein